MEIDFAQLDEHSESEKLEFKESFDKQTLETIGAFANTAGGAILVGVRDDGHVTGVNVGNTTLEDWAQRMQLKLQPRFLPSMTKRQHNNRTVIVISVERSHSLIAVDGRYYKRVGRTNQTMGPDEHTQRLLAAGNRSWDSEIEESATLADLDENSINTILVRLNSVGRRSIPADGSAAASFGKARSHPGRKTNPGCDSLTGK